MKHSFLLLLSSILILSACNNNAEQPSATTEAKDTSKQEEVKIQVPNTVCYLNVTGKDSIFLKTEILPNVVTGTLKYKFFEKDNNNGEIDGTLHGDTLIADYKFMSEGVQSIRKVMFLITGNTATEIYESGELKDGKPVYKKSTELQKLPCPVQ